MPAQTQMSPRNDILLVKKLLLTGYILTGSFTVNCLNTDTDKSSFYPQAKMLACCAVMILLLGLDILKRALPVDPSTKGALLVATSFYGCLALIEGNKNCLPLELTASVGSASFLAALWVAWEEKASTQNPQLNAPRRDR